MTFESEILRVIDQCRPRALIGTSNPSKDLMGVLNEFESSPRLLSSFKEESQKKLLSMDYVRALTRGGLSSESGFIKEVFKRIEYLILPRAYSKADALGFLTWLSTQRGSLEWIEYIDKKVLGDFLDLLVKDRLQLIEHMAPQLFEALEILGLKMAHYAIEDKISDRLVERPDLKNAFFEIQRLMPRLIESQSLDSIDELKRHLDRCESAVEFIRSERHEKGISLDLTYHLLQIGDVISRMRKILRVLSSLLSDGDRTPFVDLIREIIISETKRLELKSYLSKNVSLLAYEITEHTGKTGEHYITSTRTQYEKMLKSAVIGGVIVAFLAMIKSTSSLLGLPPFFEAFVFSFIYAAGFLMIYSAGGVLATKQPAMTAARFGAVLDEGKNSDESMAYLCELVVKTIRSQLVALIGNFVFAFPVAVLLSMIFIWIGVPLFGDYKAHSLLESLHPFKSLSFFYAALTGVFLFLSGIFAGMANNWFIYNQVGKRLESSRLINLFADRSNIQAGVERVSQNIGYWVGNVSLGIMLGSIGLVGALFGIPLDIRHITFASAQAGAALSHLGFQESFGTVTLILGAVFMMGIINLAVSFSLALFLAIKSRGVRFVRTGELLKLLMDRFRSRPLDFFLPPKE